MKDRNQSGFTIIELLIATLIFSIILLLVTNGLIKITSNYYKGLTVSKTQDTARSIMDNIAQDVQFTTGQPNTGSFSGAYAICIGSTRYSVNLGNKLIDNDPSSHALVRDTPASCAPGTTIANLTGGGAMPTPSVELLSPNMRVAVLEVQPATVPNIYKVHVRIVYGDDDLICSPAANDCNNNNTNTYGASVPGDLSCKTTVGSQFCAVSDLNTSVEKRVP